MTRSSVSSSTVQTGIRAFLYGIVIFSIVTGSTALAFPYQHRDKVVAWVSPNYQGYRLDEENFSVRHGTGWYPVSIRLRKPLLSGTSQYNVWIVTENGDRSEWFKADGVLNVFKAYRSKKRINETDPLRLLSAIRSGDLQTRILKLYWPKEILPEIRRGGFGLLNATLESQRWRGLRANEPLEGGGRLNSDVAGLLITVEVKNRTENAVDITNDFFLAADNKFLIADFFPYEGDYDSEGPVTIDQKAEKFSCRPGETRVIKMMSRMVLLNELQTYQTISVMHIHQGWAWPAIRVPMRQELFGGEGE